MNKTPPIYLSTLYIQNLWVLVRKLWKIISLISLPEIFWFLHFSSKLSLYFHNLGVSPLVTFLFWKTSSHVLWNATHVTKLFAAKSTLKQHIEVIHEGKKTYRCKMCDKSFTCVANIRRHHKLVHSKKRLLENSWIQGSKM